MQLPISRSAGAEQPSKSHVRSGILNFEDKVVLYEVDDIITIRESKGVKSTLVNANEVR